MNEIPNTNYIKQLANGSSEFEQHLIEIIKREFPAEKEQFFSSYRQENHKDATEIVHKLKNKISILGLEEGYQIPVNFEKELKNKKTSLYPKFILILETIEDFISNL